MRYSTTDHRTVTVVSIGILMAVSSAFVAAPTAEAQCLGCDWELFCVQGATCYIIEFCGEDGFTISEFCWVDPYGCHQAGDFCYWAGLDATPVFPFGREEPVSNAAMGACRSVHGGGNSPSFSSS